MNKLRRLLLCLVFALPAAALAAQRAAPLVEPVPVEIPAKVTPTNVAKAIKIALAERQWTVASEKPGFIEAVLNARQHMLKIGLTYSGGVVSMKYEDSAELEYQVVDGVPMIHPKYTNWTQNLALSLKTALQQMAIVAQ